MWSKDLNATSLKSSLAFTRTVAKHFRELRQLSCISTQRTLEHEGEAVVGIAIQEASYSDRNISGSCLCKPELNCNIHLRKCTFRFYHRDQTILRVGVHLFMALQRLCNPGKYPSSPEKHNGNNLCASSNALDSVASANAVQATSLIIVGNSLNGTFMPLYARLLGMLLSCTASYQLVRTSFWPQ